MLDYEFRNRRHSQKNDDENQSKRPETLLDELCIYLSGASGDMRG